MSTFVSVGNATQPFSRLLDLLPCIFPLLPQPVIVQHGRTPFKSACCIAVPFLSMEEFSQYVETSDLLILHAGAGSLIHAIRAGKVPLVMPRRATHGELVDDHQVEFAVALATIGKIVLVEELDGLKQAIAEAKVRQNRLSSTATPPLLSHIKTLLAAYTR